MHFSKCTHVTRIIMEIIIQTLQICKIFDIYEEISHFIRFYSKIRVSNLPQSRNFQSSEKFLQTMFARLHVFPCLPYGKCQNSFHGALVIIPFFIFFHQQGGGFWHRKFNYLFLKLPQIIYVLGSFI